MQAAFSRHDGRYEVSPGDVTDAASIRAAIDGCDAVVHAAAMVALDDRSALAARRVNVDGTRIVIDEALAVGVDAITYVSTISLFGLGHRVIHAELPLVDVSGGYARSKLDAERLVRTHQANGAPITIIYPSGVLGPDAPELTPMHQGLVFWLASAPKTSSGAASVDVRDLAATIATSIDAPATARHVVGGHFLTWDEMWRTMSDVTGRRIPHVPIPGAALRAAGRVGDLVKKVAPFDFPMTYEAMESGTRAAPCDSGSAITALGASFRPTAQTLADTIRWMAATGNLRPALAGGLAAS